MNIFRIVGTGFTLALYFLGTLTLKPIINKNINQTLPASLLELKPGTYYVQSTFYQIMDEKNIAGPLGAEYEVECAGRGEHGLWIEGKLLIKLKKTDQEIYCAVLTKNEYNTAIK